MDLPDDDLPETKKTNSGKLGGFEDRDGDGDELFDDAEVDGDT